MKSQPEYTDQDIDRVQRACDAWSIAFAGDFLGRVLGRHQIEIDFCAGDLCVEVMP